jgi:type VI secretion system protein ImpH
MPTQSRRKNSSVIENLINQPQQYTFFQAVRLIERSELFNLSPAKEGRARLRAKNPIAGFSPPNSETLRIKGNPSFKFPHAEINSLEKNSQTLPATQWNLSINLIGLVGASGVLPYHYTELILQRLKLKDASMVHYFDLFNHRTASLFYQAATKYNLPIEYERKKLCPPQKKARDHGTTALLSLIGLGTENLQNRLAINDESLIFYSGLLTQAVRSSSGLKQLLRDYFDIPVEVQEFVGQWQELIPDVRTKLASRLLPKGQNARLGKSAILGTKGWFAQGKIRIHLGPLSKEQFYLFAPGTKTLDTLNQMVRLYVGMEQDYEFIIEVNRKDVPDKITLSRNSNTLMGWNTWLSSEKREQTNLSETFKIRASVK